MERTRLDLAEDALGVGDFATALRILDAHLAHHPHDPEALALREAALTMQRGDAQPPAAFGDLRADARHLAPPQPEPPRAPAPPLGVALLAGLHLVGSVVVGILGLAVLAASAGLGLLLLFAAGAMFGLAIGLWRLRGWAWLISLLLYGVGALIALFRFGQRDAVAILSLGFNAGVVVYLVRVGRAFGSHPQAASRRRSPPGDFSRRPNP